MGKYEPLKIMGNSVGLVQEREEFLLPNDAYPILNNAYVWRERIKRKLGCQLLGRLQRNFSAVSIGNSGASPWTFTLFTTVTPNITETNAELIPGSVTITIGASVLIDQGNGILATSPVSGVTGVINYISSVITITGATSPTASTATFSYAPGLPAMGCRTREQQNSAADQTVFFDTKYAYNYNGTNFVEFLPGTIWTGANSDFFWSTNYWVDSGNGKIFWVTNNVDPIRYTNGIALTNWVNFTPVYNTAGNMLLNALVLLPFRGRLVAFNTTEQTPAGNLVYTNRIRWAAIGTPFTTVSPIVTSVNPTAWRDDIRGQGGFLDIPTSEDIVAVGFVRDNLVIYCENSTWQLRYTGRTIAPFQIEKVNSELGALSTFGAVQFDTSLVGVGDKGVVECDSYKSNLIDVKIPDLVYSFNHFNDGPTRVHGIRDFQNRLAYWIYPSASANGTYPDKRLVYNYENDSWATFDDNYTCLGTFQAPSSRTWLNTTLPWIRCNFTWLNQPALIPDIVAGNQQGFIEYLDEQNSNDISLTITAVTGNTTTATVITSPSHNLQTGDVIEIYDIPTGTPFDNLNFQPSTPYNIVFGVIVDPNSNPTNTFQLMVYNPADDQFSLAQLDAPQTYVGGGKIAIRDNFQIQSKKFNFMDDGQSIQIGFLDILMDSTGNEKENTAGAISLNIFLDYNTIQSSNTLPMNEINQDSIGVPDTFFNSIIPTTQSPLNTKGGTKFWQRVFCPTRANFLTLQYSFNNSQMASNAQSTDVQIDAQILHVRRGGRMTQC